MLDIKIPGAQPLRLSHLILDYNGTLACGGAIFKEVAERLEILAKYLEIHIVTADTFGSVRTQVATCRCSWLSFLPRIRPRLRLLILRI